MADFPNIYKPFGLVLISYVLHTVLAGSYFLLGWSVPFSITRSDPFILDNYPDLWREKYDRKDLMNTRVLVQTDDELTRIKALQKELKQLKELLIKKDLDKLIDDSYLKVAANKLGYKDVLELKKKLNI